MIIKKVNIITFGGLKNKVIEFKEGINLIYGENEAGKSTIQAFIKIWLYGFNNSRGKDLKINERLKYMPSSGEKIKGELYVEFGNKIYVIKRSFGNSKKEDTSVIINLLTGDEVNEIDKYEPGKYFLNINRDTFNKTLFIGQLGSEISKDKDEEILDKLLNSLGISEGDVTLDRAFMKIENYKKNLSNVRKTGYLDKLKEKYTVLLSERFERYNLAEKNLENEENLINLRKEKKEIIEDIERLETHKKYLKQIESKREYEDIISYLIKKEEIEKEKKILTNRLIHNNQEISISTIDLLKAEYSMYLKMLELKEKNKSKLDSKLGDLEELEKPLEKYKYIEKLSSDFSNELIKIKIEQEALKEKIDINENIDKEINILKNREKAAKEYIGNAYKIEAIKEDIERELEIYEERLKSFKFAIENKKNNNSLNNIFLKIALGIVTGILIVLGLIFSSFVIKIILFMIAIISTIFLLFINKLALVKEKSYINTLKKDIANIELKLDEYSQKVGVVDFEQLIRTLKLYDEYLVIKNNIEIKIKEKYAQKELLNLEESIKKFNLNKEKIEGYLEISNSNNIDSLIYDITKYEEINKDYNSLRYEIKSIEEVLNDLNKQIESKKNQITQKLISIGLENTNILDIEEKLDEIKEMIIKKEELAKDLLSAEETYLALIKGKNVEEIKAKSKEILNIDFKFKYTKEDEVDEAIKIKSNRLIQVEKEIKDLENEINNILNNKRSISEIEDEIILIELDIDEEEKNLKAVDLAKEVLNEAYDGLRDNFGPIVNKKVMSVFNEFTSNKYSNVLVSDNYEMKVVYKNQMLSAKLLSNGANDQLYLALRIAFIEMIFNNKNITLYLDDAFTQYDDNRIKNILDYLAFENFMQVLIFTCQNREKSYFKEKSIKHNYISL